MNILNSTRLARGVAVVVLELLTAPVLVACGDDDDASANPTTTIVETVEQYGVRINAECPGSDPGFDPFLAAHPVPTADDWAEFLPSPRKMLSELRGCIAASRPPASLTNQVDGVVAAFDVVIEDFDNAIAAAQSGDLEGTNRWITQMHDIDQPKIDEAIAQVG